MTGFEGVTFDWFITGGVGVTPDSFINGFTFDWVMFLFSPWITDFPVYRMLIFDSRMLTFFVWLAFKFDSGTFIGVYLIGDFYAGFYGDFCGDCSNLDSANLPGYPRGFTVDYWMLFTSLWPITVGFLVSYNFLGGDIVSGWVFT